MEAQSMETVLAGQMFVLERERVEKNQVSEDPEGGVAVDAA